MSEFAAEITKAVDKFREYLPKLLAEVAREYPSKKLLRTKEERFDTNYDPAESSGPTGSIREKKYSLADGKIMVIEKYSVGTNPPLESRDFITYKEFACTLPLKDLKTVADEIRQFDRDKYLKKLMAGVVEFGLSKQKQQEIKGVKINNSY